MLRNTAIGFAAAASLALGAVAITPAFAGPTQGLILVNYGLCTEQPEAKGCPGYYTGEPGNTSSFRRGVIRGAMHAHKQPGTMRRNQKG